MLIGKERARTLLGQGSRLRVLVVGDLMLDHWVWGTVTRISPEAPIPVVDVERYTHTPGGAANVVSNLRALGARVGLLGVVGRDDSGRKLRAVLRRQGADVDGILTDPTRPTALKTRIVAHHQQVVRADYERRHPLDESMQGQLLDWFAKHWEGYDAVLLSDYNKGVFRPDTARRMLAELAGRRPAVAGPKPENFDLFGAARLVTLNAREAAAAAGRPTDNEEHVRRAGADLRGRLAGGSLLITRGEHGMTLFAGDRPVTVPALATQVFDVSGAGDTVLATVGLALAAGGTDEEAIRLASHAAAVVVRKLGTATASPDEILAALP